MSQPLHHSFILRPANAPMTGYVDARDNSNNRRQVIPPEHHHHQQQQRPRPHLTLLRNKTLTSPPQWSRRRQCPKPTQLLDKFDVRQHDFLPPTSPTYWKERCLRFQQLCQSSRKRIRDMEEDQRQLRRRIHYLEERLTNTNTTTTTTTCPTTPVNKARSVTPLPVPTTIVANTTPRECFYLADCEGMSDSEYGEHYYCTFDEEDEEEEDDSDDAPAKEEQGEKKKEAAPKENCQTAVEQRDDTE